MNPEDMLRIILSTYPVGIYTIDTLEISHSLFTQTYYLTREPAGITAFDENGLEIDFTGANFEPVLNSTKNDLDENFQFTLPDINNYLDDELSRIPLNNDEKIACIYRGYNSDDLSAPSYGPIRLEVLSVSQQKGIFTISAGAPQLNWSQTGIIYDYDTFPMLRALL